MKFTLPNGHKKSGLWLWGEGEGLELSHWRDGEPNSSRVYVPVTPADIEALATHAEEQTNEAPEICGVGLPSAASRAIPEIAELTYRAIRQPKTTSIFRLGDETVKISQTYNGNVEIAVGDTIKYVDRDDLLAWCREHAHAAGCLAVHTIAGVPIETYKTSGELTETISRYVDDPTIELGSVALVSGVAVSGEKYWLIFQDGERLGRVTDTELRQWAGLKNIAGDLDLHRWQREVAQTEEPPKQVDLAATQGHNGLAKGTNNMSIWTDFLGELKAGAIEGAGDAITEGFSEAMKAGLVRLGVPREVCDMPIMEVLIQLGGPQGCLMAHSALPEGMQSPVIEGILKRARSSGTRNCAKGASRAAIDGFVKPLFQDLMALGAAPEPEGELPTVTQVEAD